MELLGKAGIFGWRPGHAGMYSRVRVELKQTAQMSLTEAKDYILDFLKRNPQVYEAAESFDDLEVRVDKADSVDALMRALS